VCLAACSKCCGAITGNEDPSLDSRGCSPRIGSERRRPLSEPWSADFRMDWSREQAEWREPAGLIASSCSCMLPHPAASCRSVLHPSMGDWEQSKRVSGMGNMGRPHATCTHTHTYTHTYASAHTHARPRTSRTCSYTPHAPAATHLTHLQLRTSCTCNYTPHAPATTHLTHLMRLQDTPDGC
jgi:hypothetical protein